MLKEIVSGDYTVKELTLGDMRKIQKESKDNDDLQYLIAAKTIYKDGEPIGLDGVDALPMSEANKLLEVIVKLNMSEGGAGNA